MLAAYSLAIFSYGSDPCRTLPGPTEGGGGRSSANARSVGCMGTLEGRTRGSCARSNGTLGRQLERGRMILRRFRYACTWSWVVHPAGFEPATSGSEAGTPACLFLAARGHSRTPARTWGGRALARRSGGTGERGRDAARDLLVRVSVRFRPLDEAPSCVWTATTGSAFGKQSAANRGADSRRTDTRRRDDHEQDDFEAGAGPSAATGQGAGPLLRFLRARRHGDGVERDHAGDRVGGPDEPQLPDALGRDHAARRLRAGQLERRGLRTV